MKDAKISVKTDYENLVHVYLEGSNSNSLEPPKSSKCVGLNVSSRTEGIQDGRYTDGCTYIERRCVVRAAPLGYQHPTTNQSGLSLHCTVKLAGEAGPCSG